MSTFDEREKAFERKFEHDQELQFKANSRRNKLLGLWAAGLMGKTGDAAESYAREIVVADLEKPGHQDVVDRYLGRQAGLIWIDLEQQLGRALSDDERARTEKL